MIARSVNKHIPSTQLDDPYFSQFLYEKNNILEMEKIMDIDRLPCFV
jgi:hypothetical protein